jgi:hypothetical protein
MRKELINLTLAVLIALILIIILSVSPASAQAGGVILGSQVSAEGGNIVQLLDTNTNMTLAQGTDLDALTIAGSYILMNGSAPTYILNFPYRYSSGVTNITGRANTAADLIIRNQTIGTFKILAVQNGYLTQPPIWDDMQRTFTIYKGGAAGDLVVYVGNMGVPLQVEDNGQIYTNWVYDIASQQLTIKNVSSTIVLRWALPAPVGGGGGGPTVTTTQPLPGPSEIPQIVAPPTNLITAGLFGIIFIIGGALAYREVQRRLSLSAAWRKRNKVRKIKWKRRRYF